MNSEVHVDAIRREGAKYWHKPKAWHVSVITDNGYEAIRTLKHKRDAITLAEQIARERGFGPIIVRVR